MFEKRRLEGEGGRGTVYRGFALYVTEKNIEGRKIWRDEILDKKFRNISA